MISLLMYLGGSSCNTLYIGFVSWEVLFVFLFEKFFVLSIYVSDKYLFILSSKVLL